MKKWYCTVCGYSHSGNEPEVVCPICGAKQNQFLEKVDESKNEKQWICTICGYSHFGDEAVDVCPICGALKILFHEYISTEKDKKQSTKHWKEEVIVDIVVVGSGAGALSSAVTGIDNGEKVVILEKASTLGGTTRRSGGRYWIPNNYLQKEMGIIDKKEDAIAYMARYSFPVKFNKTLGKYGLTNYEYEMLENYYDNATKMHDYFKKIGVFESSMDMSWTGTPHVDYMQNLEENNNVRGRSIYPKVNAGSGASGNDLIELFITWLENHKADIRTEHKVVKAITNNADQVVSVTVETPEYMQKFYARKGVIFGSGGFSQNSDLIKRFHAHPLVGGCAVPTNTGDLISISENIGAMLGNMSNAFRVQSIYEEYLKNPDAANSTFYFIGDSFLEVNKYGKRVVNEKRNYNDRTQIHYVWDSVKAEYPNQFLFLIMDQRILNYWAGFPPYPSGNPEKAGYMIKGKTLSDLAEEIEKRLTAINFHTGSFKLDNDFATNLINTIEKFNGFAKNGKDEDFGRGENVYDREYASLPPFVPNVEWPEKEQLSNSMYPLSSEGPYYGIILAPGSLDTNGGPMTNIYGQFLRSDYTPIDGIYGAGNCIASPGINAYWGAGATIGPAMTYGYLAGNHASKSKEKKK